MAKQLVSVLDATGRYRVHVEPLPPPTPQEAGLEGARRRWGPRRTIKLNDFTPAQRRLILALVDAVREHEMTAPTGENVGAAASEGHANDRPAA